MKLIKPGKIQWNDKSIRAWKSINTMTEVPAGYLKQFPEGVRDKIKIYWNLSFTVDFLKEIYLLKQANKSATAETFDSGLNVFLTEGEIIEAITKNADFIFDVLTEVNNDIENFKSGVHG